ncbi:hypothetical protein [Pseudoalteromonas sp.]|jgi:hypothetical protein|uniref:hypothetical protein n=1 Tax=Pseudoalteromonas sp. TaxID=53249 RepID=UPI002357CC65|nr:hypothetical protein [Pseudoalteromonas sp.]
MQVNYDPVKLAALKLATLNWWDRKWVIAQLPNEQKTKVKRAFSELKKLNIQNEKALLLRLTEQVTQTEHVVESGALDSYLKHVFEESNEHVTESVKSLLVNHLSSNTKHTTESMD